MELWWNMKRMRDTQTQTSGSLSKGSQVSRIHQLGGEKTMSLICTLWHFGLAKGLRAGAMLGECEQCLRFWPLSRSGCLELELVSPILMATNPGQTNAGRMSGLARRITQTIEQKMGDGTEEQKPDSTSLKLMWLKWNNNTPGTKADFRMLLRPATTHKRRLWSSNSKSPHKGRTWPTWKERLGMCDPKCNPASSGFAHMEALLNKKHRAEWRCARGPQKVPRGVPEQFQRHRKDKLHNSHSGSKGSNRLAGFLYLAVMLIHWGCGSACSEMNSCGGAGRKDVPTLGCKQIEFGAVDLIHQQALFPGEPLHGEQPEEGEANENTHSPHVGGYEEVSAPEELLGVTALTFHRTNSNASWRRIYAWPRPQWPDLRTTSWKIHKVHDTIKDTYHVEDSEHFVVWSEVGQMTARSPNTILVEESHWDLTTGEFHNLFYAESLWEKFVNLAQFVTFPNLQEECNKTPCPVQINDRHLHWRGEAIIHMAHHVVVHIIKNEQEIRRVIPCPATVLQAGHHELPELFLHSQMGRETRTTRGSGGQDGSRVPARTHERSKDSTLLDRNGPNSHKTHCSIPCRAWRSKAHYYPPCGWSRSCGTSLWPTRSQTG